MDIQRIAAFSLGDRGGNPAGVVIADRLPEEADMRRVAAEVGFSETAFAAPEGEGWRVRYFAPAREVDFCGHATIALGAALGRRLGAGRYALRLNRADISVEAERRDGAWRATLTSPATSHHAPDPALRAGALELFGLSEADLADWAAPRVISAGGPMLLLPVATRERLARLDYDLDAGARLLNAHGIVGAYLVRHAGGRRFDARLPFPTGGVYEDPATGAAAAAFSGWLRDTGRMVGEIEIVQGEDMGAPSRLIAVSGPAPRAPVNVSGETRPILDAVAPERRVA